MGLKKDIWGEVKIENNRKESKEKWNKKKAKEINFEGKKNLIVIEDWKIFTYYWDDMKIYIESIPEDYNVYYILENDTSIIINKDYKKIAPMVKYLLWNVYESLELKYMRRVFWIFIIIWFFTMVFMSVVKIYSPSMREEIIYIKDYIESINTIENIDEIIDPVDDIELIMPWFEDVEILDINDDTDKWSRW